MPVYQSGSSGGIGSLLRQIQEEKANNPAFVPPASDVGSPIRDTVVEPLKGPNDPGSGLAASLKPEIGATPQVAPPSPEGGPLAFPQVPKPPVAPTDPMVSAEGSPYAAAHAKAGLPLPTGAVVPRSMLAAGLQIGSMGGLKPEDFNTPVQPNQPSGPGTSTVQLNKSITGPGLGTAITKTFGAVSGPVKGVGDRIIQGVQNEVNNFNKTAEQILAEFKNSPEVRSEEEWNREDARRTAIETKLFNEWESLAKKVNIIRDQAETNRPTFKTDRVGWAKRNEELGRALIPLQEGANKALEKLIAVQNDNKQWAATTSGQPVGQVMGTATSSGQSSGGGGSNSSNNGKPTMQQAASFARTLSPQQQRSAPITTASIGGRSVPVLNFNPAPAPSAQIKFNPAPQKQSAPNIGTIITNAIKSLFGRK